MFTKENYKNLKKEEKRLLDIALIIEEDNDPENYDGIIIFDGEINVSFMYSGIDQYYTEIPVDYLNDSLDTVREKVSELKRKSEEAQKELENKIKNMEEESAYRKFLELKERFEPQGSKELKPSGIGIVVDKTNAKEEWPMRSSDPK
jgi:gas vesicle protein